MRMQRCQPLLVLGLTVSAGFVLVSCRREPASATDAAQEIRGDPIAPSSTAPDQSPATVKQDAVALSPPAPRPGETLPSVESVPEQRAGKGPASDEPFALGFDKLSAFTYDMPADLLDTNQVTATKSSEKIPLAVRAFDRKAIALKGFMLPLKVEGGLVTELLILRDQTMCCYGAVPKINEWVSVKMAGKGVKPIMDQPVTLVGKLHVGEVRENGYLIGIYTMDGDRITNPPGL